MALVLILFSWYSRPSEAQLKAQRERDSIAAAQQLEAQNIEAAEQALQDSLRGGSTAATALPDSASLLFAASQGTEQLITLENDLVKVTITTHGGVIEEAIIKGHLDQDKQPVRLLTKEDARLSLALAAKQENIRTSDLYFQVVSPNPAAASDSALPSAGSVPGGFSAGI